MRVNDQGLMIKGKCLMIGGKHSVSPLVSFLYSGSALGIGIGIGINLELFYAIFNSRITSPSSPISIPTPKRKLKNDWATAG